MKPKLPAGPAGIGGLSQNEGGSVRLTAEWLLIECE